MGIIRKEITMAAMAAKAIKRELSRFFPKDKFSVKAHTYKRGDAIHIYSEGPTAEEVFRIVGKYQIGYIKNGIGMDEWYEFDNVRKDIPQVKYIKYFKGAFYNPEKQ